MNRIDNCTPPDLPQLLSLRALIAQCRRLLPALLIIYLPVACVLSALVLFWKVTGTDVQVLTRDPLSMVEAELLRIQQHPEAGLYALADLHIPVYTGAVAQLGILLWASTVTICGFAGWRARRGGMGVPPAFFFLAGAASIVLLADDVLLLHERVFPQYFGANEKLLFVVYAAGFGYYSLRYRRELLSTDFLLLGLAFVFFGASLLADLFGERLPWNHLLEDGAKFTGIASWNAYYWRTALQRMP